MSQEKIKILEMLENGKITSNEASDLLEAIESGDGNDNKIIPMSKEYSKKYLKIRVYEANEDTKVKVNIPIKLVKAGLSIAKRFDSNIQGVDISDNEIEAIFEAIDSELDGEIINIEADGGETTVKIFIE